MGARLVLLLLVAVLAGCAGSQERTYGGAFVREPQSREVRVRVVFGTAEETAARCNELNRNKYLLYGPPACVRLGNPATVYVRRPASWEDAPPICQLGHEVLHTLGAEH